MVKKKAGGKSKAQRPVYRTALVVALAASLLVIRPLEGAVWDGWDYAKAVVGTVVGLLAAPAGPWASGAAGLGAAAMVDRLEAGVRNPSPVNGSETLWNGAP